MNDFDDFIRAKAKEEKSDISDSAKEKIEKTLSSLSEKEIKKTKLLSPAISLAASLIIICLIILPNVSTVYAKTMEKIPIISDIVKAVTIRNYFYTDEYHEMNISVPKIESENHDADEYINKDIDELTKILSDRFNEDLKIVGIEGHSSIYVDYDVITNTQKWFTLKITVHEAAGSSNTYYKYYHIDNVSGKIVQLSDIVANDEFYTVTENNIKEQMRSLLDPENGIIYWVDDAFVGWDFNELSLDHNFYWNDNGDLVIVFDKYEVAPGSMGTPEFTVSKSIIKDYLKQEYR